MPVVQLEKSLLEAGVTLVFSEGVSLPYAKGQQDMARDIGLLFGYYQGGEELRKHAERVLGYQRMLAEQGYRTGGNAGETFSRVLVDAAGTVLEKLPPGELGRPAVTSASSPTIPSRLPSGCGFRSSKRQGWGCKRITNWLNERGIPSPDAGKTRTDHGVKRRVTGKWRHNTVNELCRNPIILGVQRYGRRSEGTLRRLGAKGPRLLGQRPGCDGGGIVFNDSTLQIGRTVVPSSFDAERWQTIQQQMDEGFSWSWSSCRAGS